MGGIVTKEFQQWRNFKEEKNARSGVTTREGMLPAKVPKGAALANQGRVRCPRGVTPDR